MSKKLQKKVNRKSSKKSAFQLTIHHVLGFLGLAVLVAFFGFQLTQTKQSLAWGNSCNNNNQCRSNQKCAYDWAGRKVCQNLDCHAELSGDGHCNGNLYCQSDTFGTHITNHACVSNCGVYKTYWGNYACGYCYTNRDCSNGSACSNHKCVAGPTPTPEPSCYSNGGKCYRSCQGGQREIAGKCDRYNRLSCCK